jgi:hypothetical protein
MEPRSNSRKQATCCNLLPCQSISNLLASTRNNLPPVCVGRLFAFSGAPYIPVCCCWSCWLQ